MKTLKEINSKIAELENEKELVFFSEIKKVFEDYPNYSISLSCSMESNDQGGSYVNLTYIEDVEEIQIDGEEVIVDEDSSFEIKDFLSRLEDILIEIDDDYLYDKLSNGDYIYLNKETVDKLK